MIKISEKQQLHNIFQPIFQVDQNLDAEINTYEMLLRNADNRFPGMDFIDSLATADGNRQWIEVGRQSLHNFLDDQPARRVYINIEPCQLNVESIWQFLNEVRHQYKQQVAVEITERRKDIHDIDYLDGQIQRLKKMGFDIAIDDVCAGSNSYAFIVRQLDEIKRIKLSLLLFKNEDKKTRKSFVQAWMNFAAAHHLDFVIEGISDKQIAREFAGNPDVLQQGFYWGKGVRSFN